MSKSSLSPKTQEICTTFFFEYKDHRGTKASEDRIKECDTFIIKIEKSTSTLLQKLQFIDELGNAARKAQIPKDTLSKWLPENLLQYFRKRNSLWMKTLHAVRTCIVADILKSNDSAEFLKHVAELRAELFRLNKQIDDEIANKVEAAATKEERDKILIKLLDRQDEQTLTLVAKWDRFPSGTPEFEASQLPEQFKTTKDTRLVYDNNYYSYFFLKEVGADSTRKCHFDVLFLKYQEMAKSNNNNQLSILNDEFISLPVFKTIIQENLNAAKASVSSNPLSNANDSSTYNTPEFYHDTTQPSVTSNGIFQPPSILNEYEAPLNELEKTLDQGSPSLTGCR